MPRGSTYSPEAMSARRAGSGAVQAAPSLNGHAYPDARPPAQQQPGPPSQVPAVL